MVAKTVVAAVHVTLTKKWRSNVSNYMLPLKNVRGGILCIILYNIDFLYRVRKYSRRLPQMKEYFLLTKYFFLLEVLSSNLHPFCLIN